MAVDCARGLTCKPPMLGVFCTFLISVTLIFEDSARAQHITNETAVFAALDKVTARISRLEIGLNQTVRFGSLKITPRSCFTGQPTEPPKTVGFVEVQELKLDGTETSQFSGWMFAESPGLNALEHPVFDIWLTECLKPTRNQVVAGQVPQPVPQSGPAKGPRGQQRIPAPAVADDLPPDEVRRPRRVPR